MRIPITGAHENACQEYAKGFHECGCRSCDRLRVKSRFDARLLSAKQNVSSRAKRGTTFGALTTIRLRRLTGVCARSLASLGMTTLWEVTKSSQAPLHLHHHTAINAPPSPRLRRAKEYYITMPPSTHSTRSEERRAGNESRP